MCIFFIEKPVWAVHILYVMEVKLTVKLNFVMVSVENVDRIDKWATVGAHASLIT